MFPQEEQKKILIVDDESSIRDSLKLILGRSYAVDAVENGNQAIDYLANKVSADLPTFPDLVLLDVMMPGIDGIALLEKIKTEFPKIPVIMLSASNTVKTAVHAMKIGAVDFLNKPFDVDELLSLINETIVDGATGKNSPEELITFKQNRSGVAEVSGDYGSIVGNHPLMAEIFHKVDQIAKRDTTVLITGESGTGKELIAREIHQRSNRANGPFVALNCAAIPESLIESELFGHEKGAFTHAVEKRLGHFELANGGTLFLDEIGELSLQVQVKILRFLQEQEFYRIGRSKPINVDVRVLTATNRNLEKCIEEGTFRQDLYYRIHVVAIELPPLRKRREDVPALANFFIKRLAPLYGNKNPVLSAETLNIFQKYSWPGNVRELENVIESILALSNTENITINEIPARIRQAMQAGELKTDVLDGNMPFEEAEKVFESDLIIKALQKSNYVQTKAAEILGISRRILKYKMDKLGISDKPTTEEK
ncbi:MAG: sigma-54-dependent Fis family transcriptional regulator [Proteobacteria bacterium]|nr:sigma-54-dependent Fis family transcriptional regulator [Pseudomonadota bacterium]